MVSEVRAHYPIAYVLNKCWLSVKPVLHSWKVPGYKYSFTLFCVCWSPYYKQKKSSQFFFFTSKHQSNTKLFWRFFFLHNFWTKRLLGKYFKKPVKGFEFSYRQQLQYTNTLILIFEYVVFNKTYLVFQRLKIKQPLTPPPS